MDTFSVFNASHSLPICLFAIVHCVAGILADVMIFMFEIVIPKNVWFVSVIEPEYPKHGLAEQLRIHRLSYMDLPPFEQ